MEVKTQIHYLIGSFNTQTYETKAVTSGFAPECGTIAPRAKLVLKLLQATHRLTTTNFI